jgi:hypothetical protein
VSKKVDKKMHEEMSWSVYDQAWPFYISKIMGRIREVKDE